MSEAAKRSIVRRVLGAARRAVRPHRPLPRSEYKAVWNGYAATEESAKLVVAGYTDEEELRRTADYTVATLERCVGVRSSDVILEIGAGVGRVGAKLAPKCAEWIGSDVSPRMVAYIRSRLAEFPNVRAVEINGYDLSPITSSSIDLVYCTVVFMHLDEWDRYNYIAEAMRVLRPGGRILVDNFNLLAEEGWNLFEQLRRLPPKDRPPQISKASTPQELVEYLRRAGFSRIDHEQSGMWVVAWGHKP